MTIPLERNLSPEVVHTRVREAHKSRRSAERVLAFYLKEVDDRRLYEALGYESIRHYARDVAELTTRQTRELLRVAEALERLPLLAKAYSTAFLPWSTVREISRVASAQTEEAWIKQASAVSCRAVERLVARACVGDSPDQAKDRPPGEGVGLPPEPLVLSLRPEIKAAFEEALRVAMRVTGGSLEEAIVFMTEQTLEGAETAEDERPLCEKAEGPPCQMVIYRCEGCGGTTVGRDGAFAPPSLEARAGCDAEVVNLNEGGKATKTVAPRVRRAVLLRDGHRCVVPGCSNRLWLEVHHVHPRAEGGSHEAGNLVTLCSRHHGMVHEGWLRAVREGSRVRWFGRTGRDLGKKTTHVGRFEGALAGAAM